MASPSYQQSATGAASNAAAAVLSTLTPGSFILIYAVDRQFSRTITSLVSSAGNTYTLIPGAGSGVNGAFYGGPNTAGAVAETITATFTGSTGVSIVAAEFTGVNNSAPYDGVGAVAFASSSPVTLSSFMTALPNDLLVVLGCNNNNGTISFTGSYSGFANKQNTNNVFLSILAEASAGTYAPTFTQTGSVFDLIGTVSLALQVAATPTFSPVAGTYTGTQTVTISSTTSGGTIYYTTDGTTPTHGSSSISNGGTVSVASSLTLKAIESASGYNDSAVGSAAYTINSSGGGAGFGSLGVSLLAATRRGGR